MNQIHEILDEISKIHCFTTHHITPCKSVPTIKQHHIVHDFVNDVHLIVENNLCMQLVILIENK